ncbi:MAG: hypothetical protein ACP5OR_08465 [Candidatus Dormibacteria bacterium]
MAKRTGTYSVDDVLVAIDTARDKVMADEVKGLVKLGLPRSVAMKMVEDRYRQRQDGEEQETESNLSWGDMS